MKYYTRTTHDFDNETREWKFREHLADLAIDKQHSKSPCGIHALDSGRWMTLYEISNENLKYYKQYKEDFENYDIGNLDNDILSDLEEWEKLDLVKSKII